MATKLSRQTLLQFGASVNGASEVGEFGSGAAGTPVYTASITLIQSLAAWGRGWAAETIANNRPFLEDMNAVDCVFGYMLSYLFQSGIPEYDAGTTYFINSITQTGGVVYQCFFDNSGSGVTGAAPPNVTYWKVLQKGLSAPVTSYAVNTIYQAATDLYVVAYGSVVGSTNFPSAGTYSMTALNGPSSASNTVDNCAAWVQNSFNITQTKVVMFVPKGYYWEVTTSGQSGTIVAVPSGS